MVFSDNVFGNRHLSRRNIDLVSRKTKADRTSYPRGVYNKDLTQVTIPKTMANQQHLARWDGSWLVAGLFAVTHNSTP